MANGLTIHRGSGGLPWRWITPGNTLIFTYTPMLTVKMKKWKKWTWKWEPKFVSVKIRFHLPMGRCHFPLIMTTTFCHKIPFLGHFCHGGQENFGLNTKEVNKNIAYKLYHISYLLKLISWCFFISLLSTNKSWCSEPNNFPPPQHPLGEKLQNKPMEIK